MKQAKWIVVVGLAGLGILGYARAEIGVGGGTDSPSKPAPATAAADEKTPSSEVATEREDTLGFLNQDKLHGNLLAVKSGDHGLKWKHGGVDKAMDFGLAGVADVKLAPRKLVRGSSSAAIYLTNGDILPGNIVALDGEKLVLDTWYAGKLNVNRLMIKSISPNIGVSSLVYEGPNNLKEWTTRSDRNQTSWRFKNGALLGAPNQQPIGRDIEEMPDVADIQFDAGWRAYPAFSFMFHSDNVQEGMGNGYMLQVSGTSIYLQRSSRNSGTQSVGEGVNHQPFNGARERQFRFRLLVDSTQRTVALYINEQIVKQWRDANGFDAKGKGISFRPGGHGDLKISRIRIGKWDGKLPELTGGGSDKVVKEDLVRLVNNEKVSGQLKSIADGNAKFETSYATLDIPLARIVEVTAASEKAERARKNKDDIRIRFSDRGQATLQLTQIEKDDVKGKSENFGEISLPLGALRLLEFNIYQDRRAEGDEYSASAGELSDAAEE